MRNVGCNPRHAHAADLLTDGPSVNSEGMDVTYRLKKKPAAEARPWIANAIIRSMAKGDGPRPHIEDGQWQAVRPPFLVHLFRQRRRDENRSPLPSVICAALLMVACLITLWPRGSDAQMNPEKRAPETAASPYSVKPPVD